MGIRLSIALGKTKADSSVDVSGFDIIQPSTRLMREFGLPLEERGYHEALWGVCNRKFGSPPDWFFATESPEGVPWNHTRSEWADYPGGFYADIDDWIHYLPRVEKKPLRAAITDITSKPDAFATRTYANPSRFAAADFGVSLGKEVGIENSLTTGHEWSAGISATLGVEVGGDVQGYKVSASTTISFGYSYSRQETATSHVTHMVQDSVQVRFHDDAPADAQVQASLMASSGSVRVAVDYEYSLVGDGAFYFDQGQYGHHRGVRGGGNWRRIPLAECLASLGRPLTLEDSAVLDLGFVSDGKVVLSDLEHVEVMGS